MIESGRNPSPLHHVVSQVLKKITETHIRELLLFFTSRLSRNPELENFLLKSFLVYPHYDQVRREAAASARLNGASHHKLKDKELDNFVVERLRDVEVEIKREASESFKVFSAKLKYSRQRVLLITPEFEEIAQYVHETTKKSI